MMRFEPKSYEKQKFICATQDATANHIDRRA